MCEGNLGGGGQHSGQRTFRAAGTGGQQGASAGRHPRSSLAVGAARPQVSRLPVLSVKRKGPRPARVSLGQFQRNCWEKVICPKFSLSWFLQGDFAATKRRPGIGAWAIPGLSRIARTCWMPAGLLSKAKRSAAGPCHCSVPGLWGRRPVGWVGVSSALAPAALCCPQPALRNVPQAGRAPAPPLPQQSPLEGAQPDPPSLPRPPSPTCLASRGRKKRGLEGSQLKAPPPPQHLPSGFASPIPPS